MINFKNWQNLKEFMKKQPGFKSWSFDGDYERLIITFKSNIQAVKAYRKSNNSNNEISAYGDSHVSDSKIIVDLSKEAQKALSSDNESLLETAIQEAKSKCDIIKKGNDLIKQVMKNKQIKVTVNGQYYILTKDSFEGDNADTLIAKDSKNKKVNIKICDID